MKAGGMVMFNEKADAKNVMKAVHNNPLDMSSSTFRVRLGDTLINEKHHRGIQDLFFCE